MKTIKLSICIPIYNRKNDLDALLENIKEEIKLFEESIEVVISDNCSNDGVGEIIEKYRKVFKNFKYNRNKKNMGFDYNLNKVILLSEGRYIWLMGSDDRLAKNSIIYLFEEFKKYEFDIYILNGKISKNNKKIIRNGLFTLKDKEYMRLDKNFSEYIDNIKQDISLFFAFISSLVIKKEKYIQYKIPYYLKNSVYDHIYVLLKIIKNKGNFKYLQNTFYIAGNNKNEWNEIKGKHFYIDIVAIGKFIQDIYKNDIEEKQIKSSISKLFKRNSRGLRLALSIYYAKENNLIDELEEYLKYFELYNFKYKFFKIFLANSITYFFLTKGITIKKILLCNLGEKNEKIEYIEK